MVATRFIAEDDAAEALLKSITPVLLTEKSEIRYSESKNIPSTSIGMVCLVSSMTSPQSVVAKLVT
jgi:hypothetical protein